MYFIRNMFVTFYLIIIIIIIIIIIKYAAY